MQDNPAGFKAEEIRSVLMSSYEKDKISFESGKTGNIEHFIEVSRYPLTIRKLDKTFNIPLLKLNFGLLKEKLHQNKNESTPEDIVFFRIKNISSGNILQSKIIWQKSLQDSTVNADDIYSASFEVELDYDTKFLAYMILSMGSLSRDGLEATLGNEVDISRSLSILREHGMIDLRNGLCSISPEAIHYVGFQARSARII